MKTAERWTEHTKELPPLKVGDHVRLQNQVGLNPRKWDKTGQVVEVRQHNQYIVKVDGSGRVTLRNRKYLRKYIAVQAPHPRHTILQDLKLQVSLRPSHKDSSLLPVPAPTNQTQLDSPLDGLIPIGDIHGSDESGRMEATPPT